MTAVRLPRLSRPGVLESIAPERLFALLEPFSDFFAGRSVPIESPAKLDCQAVIRTLTQPGHDTPTDLLDAISLIDELSNAVAVDLLLERVPIPQLGLERGGQHSEADIVTAAWLKAPEKLVQTHALSRIKRVRSYDYFQANQADPPVFRTPSRKTIGELEQAIDDWHVQRFRARGTKVEIFENDKEVEFSIMHGSLYQRQPVVNHGEFGFQAFWPVQSASAIYHREFGELRINARSAKDKALYCRLLGKHLFGEEDLFPTGVKYTLDPLQEFEFDALVWEDVPGIRDVRMVELKLGDPDSRYGVVTIRRGDDLLEWAKAKSKDIRIERRFISATFQMRVQRHRTSLAVTIRPPNVAMYNRGWVAALIEEWLTMRKFIVGKRPPRRPDHVPALART